MAEFDHIYASNGKGNLGVTLGAIGTGLSALGGMNNGNGLFGGLFNGGSSNYVTKDMSDKDAEIMGLKAQIALSDSERKTNSYIDSKILDIYNVIGAKTLDLERTISANKSAQDLTNCQLSSAIAVNTNNITCIQNMLGGLTKTVIPNSSVCPGWGTATVTVSTGTSSTDTATT